MLKSEERKLEAKKREWDEGLREWGKRKHKWWRECRKEMRKAFNWYFFYEARDDGDRAYHIIMWLSVNIVVLRALGIF